LEIHFHNHALERMKERGATEAEVIFAIEKGEQFPAKFERIGFRSNFTFNETWNGKLYKTKQVEALVVKEDKIITVLTVITRYF
jgi:hypothetical protein